MKIFWINKKLEANIRKSRRETLYRMLKKRNSGVVPCFVCGKNVLSDDATLEHIIPISKGGTDDMNNLTISHGKCNWNRGNKDLTKREQVK